nr:nitroreductase family protein [Kitasatospora sp. GAS204B]
MLTSELDSATLEGLVSAAVAAPSLHNTQPWRFRFRPDTTTLEVHAVPQPALRITDPSGRGLHLSVGAAVFNLRVAIRQAGHEPVVRLLPRTPEPDLLAAVRLAGPSRPPEGGGRDLYSAIWRRHSSRLPFTDAPVPAAILTELAEAARAEEAFLELPSEQEIHRLLAATAEGERRAVSEPGRRRERWQAVQDDPSRHYGIPTEAIGPLDAEGRLPQRDFAALRPGEHQRTAAFEARPRVAVLGTARDEPADWLRAGQALERVLLLATAHGLRASLLSQALEWSDLRWALRDPRHGPGHVQMLIRLGYGPEGAPTPRAPVAEVLDRDG